MEHEGSKNRAFMAELKATKLPKCVENEEPQRKLAGSGEQGPPQTDIGTTMNRGRHPRVGHGAHMLLLLLLS